MSHCVNELGGLVLVFKCKSFLAVFSYCELLCLLVPFQTYTWQKKKLGIANWTIEGKRNNILHYCVHSEETLLFGREETRRDAKRPFSLYVSLGNLSMAIASYRYTLKRIAKGWRSKNDITWMRLVFTIFCSVSSDSFFVFMYTFLFLALAIDFC